MSFDAFRSVRGTRGRGSASFALLCSAMLLVAADSRAGAAAAEPTPPALLTTPGPAESVESIQRIITAASTAGFTAIVVPVSLYATPVTNGFDTLSEFVRQAHAHGLRVHAALDVKAATAADELPTLRTHVVYQHPEWLMVPRALAARLLPIDPHAPNYFGQIARWTRANAARLPALSLSPLSPDATAFIGDAVRTFTSRYAIDGIALQGLNYPGDDFDYSRRAIDLFRTEMRGTFTADEKVRMDGIEAIDPFAYPNEYPAEWRRFRMARLTELVARVRAAVEAARPGTLVSAAVGNDADITLDEYIQEWMDNRLLDAVTHTSGTADAVVFASSVKLTAVSLAPPTPAAADAAAGSR